MAKKLTTKGVIYLCASATALVVLLFAVLGLFSVVSPLASILVCSIMAVVGCAATIALYFLNKKLQKKKEQERIKAELIARNNYLKQLYDILKIPYQYAEDGHIKDIFELLKIKPMYDEKGNRIPLIYELLKIMPRFDKNGKELPRVFAIKNKVLKVAKGITSPLVLTYKPKAKTAEPAAKDKEGKKEEKAPSKDVKQKAKEVSKKPAKKAGAKKAEKGPQTGISIKSKAKPIKGKVEDPKSNRSGATSFSSYKSARQSFSFGESTNEATSAPAAPKAPSATKAPEHFVSEETPQTKEAGFAEKNVDNIDSAYILSGDEMER